MQLRAGCNLGPFVRGRRRADEAIDVRLHDERLHGDREKRGPCKQDALQVKVRTAKVPAHHVTLYARRTPSQSDRDKCHRSRGQRSRVATSRLAPMAYCPIALLPTGDFMRFITFSFLLCVLAACGGQPEVAPPLARDASGWVEVTPRATTIDGEVVTPACSGFPGADPAFRFWAKRGAGENLVIFFDGGGACWDDATCSQPRLASGDVGGGYYKAELLATDNPNQMDGMFNLADPRNPLRDWNMVFVPYCTGDVHSGANTHAYRDPATGQEFNIAHRGSDNFRVVLEWMRANFQSPNVILVTGSSAGAYGAVTQYARVRAAYPNGRAIMFGDAGQGVTTPGFTQARNENWGYALPADVFGEDGLRDDEDSVSILAAHFPNDRFAQYTTAHDRVQVAFYSLMQPQNACRAWTEGMWGALEQRERIGNFRGYLASGDTHTILRSPLFYTERSGGVPFSEWLSAMVSGDGAGWEDHACQSCLTAQAECPFGR